MNDPVFPFLACPLDGMPLVGAGKSVTCPKGHCFDFDRRGALNLLPVQFKQSLDPGDSPEMVAARQKFLDSGTYQPIADRLNELLSGVPQKAAILDAGCGEGYYTSYLSRLHPDWHVLGLDISKPAIQAASKRGRAVTWAVGSNKKIPVADDTLDAVVCLFGFPVWHEFRRVLKKGGVLVMADPGPEHLIEMRRILYPEVTIKAFEPKTAQEFSLMKHEALRVVVPAPGPELLAAQILMTPHHFRARPENRRAAIDAVYDGMTINVEFSVSSW